MQEQEKGKSTSGQPSPRSTSHTARHKPSSSVAAPATHLPSSSLSSKSKTPESRSKSIGHYVLGKNKIKSGRTIGEGTFGKVKLGTHILTGEKVAIKILEKNRISDQADVERVARQIHILKRIRHDNIIQLYEIIETPKQLYLIMEYASGGQLFDYIVKHNRVKERHACRFFQQIIDGVEYLFQLGIVHRDLKPENLLLDFHKRIKIVDFGLSNTYKEKQLLQTACGSPCYAAPEMIAGKRYKGVNVDVWSCGVILFAMICGYLPFEDPNTAALYKKILNGEFTIPKFVSPEGRDLIKGILTIDPSKRLTIDDIRKHKWFTQVIPQTQSGTLGFTTGYGLKVGIDAIPIDMRIVVMLQEYGFNANQAKKYLEANKHNHATTTYYLLLKRFQRTGGPVVSDHNRKEGSHAPPSGLSVSGITGLQTHRGASQDDKAKILSQTLRPDEFVNIAGYATARRHNDLMNQTIPINEAIRDGFTRRDEHSPDLWLSQKNKEIKKSGATQVKRNMLAQQISERPSGLSTHNASSRGEAGASSTGGSRETPPATKPREINSRLGQVIRNQQRLLPGQRGANHGANLTASQVPAFNSQSYTETEETRKEETKHAHTREAQSFSTPQPVSLTEKINQNQKNLNLPNSIDLAFGGQLSERGTDQAKIKAQPPSGGKVQSASASPMNAVHFRSPAMTPVAPSTQRFSNTDYGVLNLKQADSGQDSSRKKNDGLDVVPEYSSTTRKNARNKTVINELHARSIEESGDHSARSDKIDLTPSRYDCTETRILSTKEKLPKSAHQGGQGRHGGKTVHNKPPSFQSKIGKSTKVRQIEIGDPRSTNTPSVGQPLSNNVTPTNYHTQQTRPKRQNGSSITESIGVHSKQASQQEQRESVAVSSNRVDKKSKHQDQQQSNLAGIKTYRGAFDVSCITAKNPKEVVSQLVNAFQRQSITYRQVNSFSLKASKQNVRFETELMKFEDLDNVFIVRFKKLAGDLHSYKTTCGSLLELIKL